MSKNNSKLLLGLLGASVISSPVAFVVSCQNSIHSTIENVSNSIKENKNQTTTNEGAKYSPEQIVSLSLSNEKINQEKVWKYIQKPDGLKGAEIKVTKLIGTSINQKINDLGANDNNLIAEKSFIRVYFQLLKGKEKTEVNFFDITKGFKDYQKNIDDLSEKIQQDGLNIFVNKNGEQKLASEINKNNILQFVDGFEFIDTNVIDEPYLEITNVQNIAFSEIEIEMVYKLKSKIKINDENEKIFDYTSIPCKLKLSGFLTKKEKDQIDVTNKIDWLEQNVFLVVNEKGRQTPISKVNIDNFQEFLNGFPTLNDFEINNGMKINIYNVKQISQSDVLEIKFNVSQNDTNSKIISKSAKGFKL